MKKNSLKVLTGAILLAMSSMALAELNIYSYSLEQKKTDGTYSFRQQGFSSEDPVIVRGFGKKMPLDMSLDNIVPKGWKVNINPGAEKTLVNWEGKSSWPYVLENMAKNNQLNILIDWERRTVDVYSQSASESKLAKNMQTKGSDKVQNLASSSAINRIDEDKKVIYNNNVKKEMGIEDLFDYYNVQPADGKLNSFVDELSNKAPVDMNKKSVFMLKPQRMLSENLIMWGKYYNWDVVYNASRDFLVTQPIRFEDSLLGAVDTVTGLYKKSENPIYYKFNVKNNTIEFVDKKSLKEVDRVDSDTDQE